MYENSLKLKSEAPTYYNLAVCCDDLGLEEELLVKANSRREEPQKIFWHSIFLLFQRRKMALASPDGAKQVCKSPQ